MMRLRLAAGTLVAVVIASVCVSAQTVISNTAVTAMTATSATISWTTSTPATSQVYFGLTASNLNSYTPKNSTLNTSQSATITGIGTPLPAYTVIYYSAQSVDGSGNVTNSSVQSFELCVPSTGGNTQTSGTINNFYGYGNISFSWTNQSGQSITPTVCGVPISTTITTTLDGSSSFNLQIPDNLQVVPSPSKWTATVNSFGGIGVYSIAPVTISGPSNNLSTLLAAGAVGQTIFVWYDQATNTFYPPLPGTGTVNSVGLSAPSGFAVSGSPVNSSGTLTWAMPVGWSAGDLLVGAGSNAVTRLPASTGASGNCLTLNSSLIPVWSGTCGSGTTITLQTNGSNNPTQNIFNAIAGTGMTITSAVGGGVTFSATATPLTFPILATSVGADQSPIYSYAAAPDVGTFELPYPTTYAITSAARTGCPSCVSTLTMSAVPLGAAALIPGNSITIASTSDSTFTGTYPIATIAGTTITYSQTGVSNSTSTGGTIQPTGVGLSGYFTSFHRLHSFSANTASNGTIQFGPTDSIVYGCPGCSNSVVLGLTTTNQNMISANGNGGAIKLGDYQGVQFYGPVYFAGPLYITSSAPSAPAPTPAAGISALAANTDGQFCEFIDGANSCGQGSTFAGLGDIVTQAGGGYFTLGEPIVAGNSAVGVAAVPSAFDASVQSGADAGAKIVAAETKAVTYSQPVNAGGILGNQSAASNPFASTYQGNVTFGPISLTPSGPLLVPRKTGITGMGWETGNGASYVGSTVFNATSLSANSTLMCYSDDNLTCNFNNGPVFDSPITQITLNGANQSGIIDFSNCNGQEGSVVSYVNFLSYGNHGTGMDIGCGEQTAVPAFVAETHAAGVSCTGAACAVSSPSAPAGATIIACANWPTSTITLSSVSGSINHGYTLITPAGVDSGHSGFQCAYNQNTNAGVDVITFTMSATQTSFNPQVLVYTGIAPLGTVDAAATPTVSTTANPNGPSVTPVNNNDLILAIASGEAASSGTWAAGASYTLRAGTSVFGEQDRVLSGGAGVAQTPPWTITGTTARTFLATMAFLPGTNNGPGPQNSGAEWLDFSLGQGATCTSDSVALRVNTSVTGDAGPKYVNAVTATAQGCSSGLIPNNEVRIGGSHTSYSNIHMENCLVACFAIGQEEGANADSFQNLNSGNASVAETLSIASASNVGTSAEYNTVSPCDLIAGQPITISGISPSQYNTPPAPAVSVVSVGCNGASQFQVNINQTGLGSGSAGAATVQNELVLISSAYSNSTEALTLINVAAAGPNYPIFTLVDENNQVYIPTSVEPQLSFYTTGVNSSVQPGSGAGQSIITTSSQAVNKVHDSANDFESTVYDPIARYGDGQAGSANQFIARWGYFTFPQGQTQMVVSTYAIRHACTSTSQLCTHVEVTDAAFSVGAYGGFPAACNTAQSFTFRVLATQASLNGGALGTGVNPFGPTTALTGSSFTSNTATFTMASTAAFTTGNIVRVASNSIGTGGPFNTGYNGLFYITVVNSTTITAPLTYGSTIATCSSTCGTMQIWPGFVAQISTTPTSTDECVQFRAYD